ncbi:MAG: ABC transporter substrate-binding protein [Ignisphaera sp.]|nr:ABC transporter substrate-binding protein [Ignisphaera sp.]MDW8085682.1 ABC transporter substrate-binding protein [Ignisphaera sp.]
MVNTKLLAGIIVALAIIGIAYYLISVPQKPPQQSPAPLPTPTPSPTPTQTVALPQANRYIVVAYRDPQPIDRDQLVPYSNINPGFLRDPVMDALIKAGRSVTDTEIRRAIYNAIQKLSNDRLSLIWLVQARDVRVYWDWIKGIYFHPTFVYRIDDLYKETHAPNPNKLVIGESEEGHSLDPAVTYWAFDWFVIHQIYERLVTYERDTVDYVSPSLAVAWTRNEKGDEWYFVIRGDVLFYDPWENRTIPLTPNDIVYSFKRVATMHLDPSWLIEEFINVDETTVLSEEEFKGILSNGLYTEFRGVSRKVSSLEELLSFFGYSGNIAGFVKVKLKFPYVPILSVLATVPASIVSMEVVEAHGGVKPGEENQYLYDHPVGTGPYYLVEWAHRQYYKLRANPYYWKGKPAIEEIEIKLIPEDSTRIMMLKKGDIDIALVPPSLVDQVKDVELGSNKLVVDVAPSFWIHHVTLNCERYPFNISAFRKALAWAIPYDTIISTAFNGLADQAYGVIPRGMFGFQDDELTKYSYNEDMARKYLKESGVDPKSISITIIVTQGYSEQEQIATIIQSSWSKALGIDVKVQVLSRPIFNEKLMSGDFDAQVLGWGPDYIDPDDYAGPLQSGGYTFADIAVYTVASSSEVSKYIDLNEATVVTYRDTLIVVGRAR